METDDIVTRYCHSLNEACANWRPQFGQRGVETGRAKPKRYMVPVAETPKPCPSCGLKTAVCGNCGNRHHIEAKFIK